MEKRLRKGKDRILFGVCSGIAEYLEVDPTVVRLLFIVAFVLEPKVVLIYLLLAIVMPEGEGKGFDEERSRRLVAYGLIGLGVLVVLKDVLPELFSSGLIGILLIVIGFLLLKR